MTCRIICFDRSAAQSEWNYGGEDSIRRYLRYYIVHWTSPPFKLSVCLCGNNRIIWSRQLPLTFTGERWRLTFTREGWHSLEKVLAWGPGVSLLTAHWSQRERLDTWHATPAYTSHLAAGFAGCGSYLVPHDGPAGSEFWRERSPDRSALHHSRWNGRFSVRGFPVVTIRTLGCQMRRWNGSFSN